MTYPPYPPYPTHPTHLPYLPYLPYPPRYLLHPGPVVMSCTEELSYES
jgi:hypothetical protein